MPRPPKIAAILWKLPVARRDAINRSAALRSMKQDEYLAWAVQTAELASPVLAELDGLPISKSVRKQFEDAFRPVLEKNTEKETLEERIAALREAVRGILAWAEKTRQKLRVLGAERGGR